MAALRRVVAAIRNVSIDALTRRTLSCADSRSNRLMRSAPHVRQGTRLGAGAVLRFMGHLRQAGSSHGSYYREAGAQKRNDKSSGFDSTDASGNVLRRLDGEDTTHHSR